MDGAVATFATILDRLSAEHAELLPCAAKLANFAAVNAGDLGELIGRCSEKLRAPLEAHIAEEDNVLFPAYARETGDEGMVELFRSEHRELLALRDELLAAHRDQAPPKQLGGIAARLADLLISHMTREDMMLFPSARQALDRRAPL
jgi:iron-sulfur cluster repair protein YtfE (RIC family)